MLTTIMLSLQEREATTEGCYNKINNILSYNIICWLKQIEPSQPLHIIYYSRDWGMTGFKQFDNNYRDGYKHIYTIWYNDV